MKKKTSSFNDPTIILYVRIDDRMDSLLYLGAADADDDEDESGEDEEEEDAGPSSDLGIKPPLDFESLQRAGYSSSAADLTQTDTFKRLLAEEEKALEEQASKKVPEDETERLRQAALEAEQQILLDRKALDRKLAYEKRFDRTKEDFRSKEKRKRAMGQQANEGNWVEEEKRKLRHGLTGNYDS